MEYAMSNVMTYAPLFMQGIGITVSSWIIAGSISLGIGFLFGFIGCDYLAISSIKRLISIYTFITKGIPAYVHILIAYFALPSLLHINIPGFIAATGALALCSSGYMTEIVRAGINAIPQGQWDACFVLGYPVPVAIRRIIFPQVIQTIKPTLLGELEQLLKSTTLLATIGVTDITRVGINIISRELNPLPIYGIVAAIYLLFSALLYLVSTLQKRRVRS